MSKTASFLWKCILYPLGVVLGVVAISVLVAVLAVTLGTVLTLPVLLLWNWGLVAAAPLFGVTLASIGLAKAWAVGLSIMLARMLFTSGPGRSNQGVGKITEAK